MDDDQYKPIDDDAKRGQTVLVRNEATGDYAKAYWATDMWALYCGPDYETVEQLNFEPTEYTMVHHG